MRVRPTRQAGRFYPADSESCRRALGEFAEFPPNTERAGGGGSELKGGVVPHAGWTFSGRTAYGFWRFLPDPPELERLVLLGAVHVPGVSGPSLGDWEAWATPAGSLEVDREFEELLLGEKLAVRRVQAHIDEHSLEVQLPFVALLRPGLRIVPIAVPAARGAVDFGQRLGGLLVGEGRRSWVVASTDLTHYGRAYGFEPAGPGEEGFRFARANDRAFLARVEALDAEGALARAAADDSACGAGAVAAALAAAAVLGAGRAILLHHESSVEAAGDSLRRTSFHVGYAALALA